MTPRQRLVKARERILKGGWSPTGWTQDHRGRIVSPDDETATRFDILGALDADGEGDAKAAAWFLLDGVSPGGSVLNWEAEQGRSVRDVVALFARAIARASAIERGTRQGVTL